MRRRVAHETVPAPSPAQTANNPMTVCLGSNPWVAFLAQC
jgi:hypothetical protein